MWRDRWAERLQESADSYQLVRCTGVGSKSKLTQIPRAVCTRGIVANNSLKAKSLCKNIHNVKTHWTYKSYSTYCIGAYRSWLTIEKQSRCGPTFCPCSVSQSLYSAQNCWTKADGSVKVELKSEIYSTHYSNRFIFALSLVGASHGRCMIRWLNDGKPCGLWVTDETKTLQNRKQTWQVLFAWQH